VGVSLACLHQKADNFLFTDVSGQAPLTLAKMHNQKSLTLH